MLTKITDTKYIRAYIRTGIVQPLYDFRKRNCHQSKDKYSISTVLWYRTVLNRTKHHTRKNDIQISLKKKKK